MKKDVYITYVYFLMQSNGGSVDCGAWLVTAVDAAVCRRAAGTKHEGRL